MSLISFYGKSIIIDSLVDASAAIVSLYLPQGVGVDNPITADPIGVDKSGHTTWRWGVGAASGTLTVTSPGLAETSGAPLCLLIV